MEHEIAKALEIWILQNTLDGSIMAGFVALGIAMVEPYHQRIERLLTLRVSTELWRAVTVVTVDLLLAVMVVAGLFLVNPDIMADVKMAVPFYPLAVVLVAVALVLRLLHGGTEPGSRTWRRALWLLFWADLVNLAGFTFVMEAPGHEYLDLHPNAAWSWITAHLRSNAVPGGIELAQWCFWIFFPLLVAILLWAFASAMSRRGGSGSDVA